MAKTDDRIREDISIFDMLARYGGWIVVAGLVVEPKKRLAVADKWVSR